MPKLILWEKLLKEELVLLIKLLPGEQQLRRFKQSSGNAILEFGICIMLLQFCALNFFCHFHNNISCDNRKEYEFREKRNRELAFLEKVWSCSVFYFSLPVNFSVLDSFLLAGWRSLRVGARDCCFS